MSDTETGASTTSTTSTGDWSDAQTIREGNRYSLPSDQTGCTIGSVGSAGVILVSAFTCAHYDRSRPKDRNMLVRRRVYIYVCA